MPEFSGCSANRVIAGEEKGAAKKWMCIAALAGLTVGMFFVQSCSASAMAGPDGGDLVALKGVIRREGEPDCVNITEENKAMDRAVQTAQKTVNKFIEVLRAPKANQTRFAVKKPFVEADKVEHIWLTEVSFDGHLFRGKVDNEPVDIKGARPGQEVSVAANEISDWMYVEDGRLVGGYTIAAMCQHMSSAEKQQFEKDADCQIK